jgi:small subunit ribosomal protein S11
MILHLRPTSNNFFLTFLSRRGEPLFWVSAGSLGLRGPRRSTPLAAEQVARAAVSRLVRRRVRSLGIRIAGPLGSRARAALRGLAASPRCPRIRWMELVVPRAHNGLRPAKRRRV